MVEMDTKLQLKFTPTTFSYDFYVGFNGVPSNGTRTKANEVVLVHLKIIR